MTSQVLSGASNPSYTNTTGQNVRIIINYMRSVTTISWSGVSVSDPQSTIGRNLNLTYLLPNTQTVGVVNITDNTLQTAQTVNANVGLPTEVMLAPGETFSATCGVYNIVVIPEGG